MPNGTGDLMTALFAGSVLAGAAPHIAMGQATAIVQQILDVTLAGKGDELDIVAAQADLAAHGLPLSRGRVDQRFPWMNRKRRSRT